MELESRISNVLVGIILASIIITPITGNLFNQTQIAKVLIDSSIDCSQENNTPNNEIYVDNQLGLDSNSGTKNCPYGTVNHAISMANNGDIIQINEGVYHENIVIQNFENLTIKSSEGERVVFDGTISIGEFKFRMDFGF